MTKITELYRSDEQTIVSRILLNTHKAVDQEFPGAGPASKKFAKTVFTLTEDSSANKNQADILPEPPNPNDQAEMNTKTTQYDEDESIETDAKPNMNLKRLLIIFLTISMILVVLALFKVIPV